MIQSSAESVDLLIARIHQGTYPTNPGIVGCKAHFSGLQAPIQGLTERCQKRWYIDAGFEDFSS